MRRVDPPANLYQKVGQSASKRSPAKTARLFGNDASSGKACFFEQVKPRQG
jgi:hypothetical protein